MLSVQKFQKLPTAVTPCGWDTGTWFLSGGSSTVFTSCGGRGQDAGKKTGTAGPQLKGLPSPPRDVRVHDHLKMGSKDQGSTLEHHPTPCPIT